jgi:glycosyltransferase involved in cell wall biosynthesis
MRVCLVGSASVDGVPRGGVEESTWVLAHALLKEGVEVSIVAPIPGKPEKANGRWGEVPATWVGFRERLSLPTAFSSLRRAVFSALEHVRPDVTQGQGILGYGNAVTDWSSTRSVIAAHGNPLMDHRYHYGRLGGLPRTALVRRIASQSVLRACVVVNVTRSWTVNMPVKPQDMRYIPNPVASTFFENRFDEPTLKVVFLGGGLSIKGLDLLLAAWPKVAARHPDARLHAYGFAGNKVGEYRELPAGCELHGYVDASTVARLMRDCAAVVVPSRYEVSPLVVAEAMASGVPVVATAVGGTPDLAAGCAILVEPTAGSIATGLMHVLDDPAEAARMAAASRLAAEAFRPKTVARSYIAVYEDVLAQACR